VEKHKKWECRFCGFISELGQPWFPERSLLEIKDIGSLPTFMGDIKHPVKIPWYIKIWRKIWN